MNTTQNQLDLRIRRTYKFLWDALMALLAERDFEAITVTDLCERAMVHRTTFYKHYEDKHALLASGIQEELNALFEAHDTAVDKPLERDHAPEMLARVVAVFEHVQRRERFYRLMLTGTGFGQFSTRLRKALAERFERRLRRDVKHNDVPAGLEAQLHAAAMTTAITWWLEGGCAYTPIEMAGLLQRHRGTPLLHSGAKH